MFNAESALNGLAVQDMSDAHMDCNRKARSTSSAVTLWAHTRATRRKLVTRIYGTRNRRQICRGIICVTLLLLTYKTISVSDGRALWAVNPRISSLMREPTTVQGHSFHYFAFGSREHLHQLLKNITVPRRHTPAPLVVTLAVNYAYRRLALNFVCNLIRLGITNYLIFAMDQDVFDYLVPRNVNTFLYNEDTIPRDQVVVHDKQDEEDMFGTRAFAETSIRKSILVLRTLRLGFSVVFSDIDVVWVRNPIPVLLSKQGDIVIQSDRSHLEHDLPPNYKLNSGLYLARSNPRTITAFRAITKYAQAIRRSEQKAFNYVLCGAFKSHRAGPGLRVGTNECIYTPIGTTVSTLDMDCFPNGSNNELWISVKNFAKAHPRVVAIHANYVFGRADKVKRIRNIGFWFHSERTRTVDGCTIPS